MSSSVLAWHRPYATLSGTFYGPLAHGLGGTGCAQSCPAICQLTVLVFGCHWPCQCSSLRSLKGRESYHFSNTPKPCEKSGSRAWTCRTLESLGPMADLKTSKKKNTGIASATRSKAQKPWICRTVLGRASVCYFEVVRSATRPELSSVQESPTLRAPALEALWGVGKMLGLCLP